VDFLGAYRDLGVSRVMGLDMAWVDGDAPLESLVADAHTAGVGLA
jgi:hypothetical protein